MHEWNLDQLQAGIRQQRYICAGSA